jgi:hypothetical protein
LSECRDRAVHKNVVELALQCVNPCSPIGASWVGVRWPAKLNIVSGSRRILLSAWTTFQKWSIVALTESIFGGCSLSWTTQSTRMRSSWPARAWFARSPKTLCLRRYGTIVSKGNIQSTLGNIQSTSGDNQSTLGNIQQILRTLTQLQGTISQI